MKPDRLERWRRLPWFKKWVAASWQDILLLAIVLFLVWGYQHDVGVYRERTLHPCDYCVRCNPFAFNVNMPVPSPVVVTNATEGVVVLPGGNHSS